ncbi:ABC transporter substrate-binding protein [Nonomuraea sp. NPDC049480]|uniref:ABC transporter substrate-binding protein n=1 Tax=Nonomuraea sp. NPDC049480 TaxID=3364353 RepID=UPI0037A61FD4
MDVAEEPVASSPAQFRALLDGALDAALTSPDNVIAHRSAADVRIVSAVDRGLGLALYARPGLTSPAQLKGEVIGVDVPRSGFAFALYTILDSLGLRGPQAGDYRLVALGSTPRRLEALLAGECAATMLNAGSDLRAEQAGAVRVAALSDVCRPYLGTVLCGVGPNPGVRALAAALREATAAILRGDADDVVIEEAATALRLPAEAATRYLQRLKDPDEGLVADGRADAESLSTVLALRRRYATVPDGDPHDLLDRGEDGGR